MDNESYLKFMDHPIQHIEKSVLQNLYPMSRTSDSTGLSLDAVRYTILTIQGALLGPSPAATTISCMAYRSLAHAAPMILADMFGAEGMAFKTEHRVDVRVLLGLRPGTALATSESSYAEE